MKRLLLYIVIVSAFSVAISILFYWKLNEVSPMRKKLKALDYSMKSHEFNNIIFIGGSRVVTHINPRIIDSITGLKSQNISIQDIGIVEYNMLLNKYLQVHPKPEMVFMNLDVNMFFTSGPLFNINDFIPYLYDTLIYNKLSPYKIAYRSKPFQYVYFLEKIFASTDYAKSKLFDFKNQLLLNIDTAKVYSDFEPRVADWSVGADLELNTPTKATWKQEGFDLLQQVIDRCKQDTIQLVFIYSPFYYKGQTHITNFHEIFNHIKKVASKNNTPFWNYSTLDFCRSKEYFYNYSHMNHVGAKVYSTQLATDIKKFIDKKNNTVK